jgi:hypothetical protein
LTKRICIWQGCKTRIDLDVSIESRQSLFVVAGWCELHKKAYSIYREMEEKYCKEHYIENPIGSLSYKKHKKALHQLFELAEYRAKHLELKACLCACHREKNNTICCSCLCDYEKFPTKSNTVVLS